MLCCYHYSIIMQALIDAHFTLVYDSRPLEKFIYPLKCCRLLNSELYNQFFLLSMYALDAFCRDFTTRDHTNDIRWLQPSMGEPPQSESGRDPR